MTNKERFISLLKGTERAGIENLLYVLSKTDLYTAPASTRFHESYEGGLIEHSLRVYDELNRILAAYPEIKIPADSVIIAALLHDLCKVNFYGIEKRNRKNEQGKWESYNAYKVDEKFCFGGHGAKSVYIAQRYIQLTNEEAVAINCHMAAWNGDTTCGSAFEQHPFAWALHVADEASVYIPKGDNRNE